MNAQEYPFVKQILTDPSGNIEQVIVDFQDYQQILESLEDSGLYKAIMTVKDQTPLDIESAIGELED
jgi:hypothetical protein